MKIAALAIALLLGVIISLQAADFIHRIPRIDDAKWDIQWVKAYIFTDIDPSRIYNYHSYVRNPPRFRRAIRKMVIFLEVPKEDVRLVLEGKTKKGATLIFISNPSKKEAVLRDIDDKLGHIRRRLRLREGDRFSFLSLSSDKKRVFAFRHSDPESGGGHVVIDKSGDAARKVIIYVQGNDY